MERWSAIKSIHIYIIFIWYADSFRVCDATEEKKTGKFHILSNEWNWEYKVEKMSHFLCLICLVDFSCLSPPCHGIFLLPLWGKTVCVCLCSQGQLNLVTERFGFSLCRDNKIQWDVRIEVNLVFYLGKMQIKGSRLKIRRYGALQSVMEH